MARGKLVFVRLRRGNSQSAELDPEATLSTDQSLTELALQGANSDCNASILREHEKAFDRLAHIETPLTLSIIGCVVNGPGEALMTDLGLTGGGNGRHMIYSAGKTDHTIDGASMVDHIVELVEAKAAALKQAAAAEKLAAE